MFLSFLKTLGVTLGIVWLLLIPVLHFFTPHIAMTEILIGCALPVLCFIPGFYAISWSAHRPFRSFIVAVFGGMLIRLFFIGTVFILIAKLTDFHITSVLFSLVGFYTLCLAIELYFVNYEARYLKEHMS